MEYAIPMPPDLPEAVVTPNALTVLERRYFRKGPNGELLENATQMYWRVASAIAWIEDTDNAEGMALIFYKMMANGEFLPNSPTLMNAGKPNGQLSACFVLPIGDSMEEIFDAVKFAALIHKSGGGTGFSFSRLRPRDSRVGSTGGVASGPISFMRIFNTATEQVKQGGTRRGANMGILRVDHPDIIEFIKCKETEGELQNFNLSVGLTAAFMDALARDVAYELRDPRSGNVVGKIFAHEVFDTLVDNAWRSGDPGIVFLDRINETNPTPHLGEIEATNPCGEQPLLPYEACNLGSINVSKFFDATCQGEVNWTDLKYTVRMAVRFLDNVIDANTYPLPEITEMVKTTRKIGLGVMGFADLLYLMRIPYDSTEGVVFGEALMECIQKTAHEESEKLARSKGAYPAHRSGNPTAPWYRRNATVTTIAPTGTLSILANCSSGIEPLFALSFTKHVMDNDKLVTVNEIFQKAMEEYGMPYCVTLDVTEKLANGESVRNITELPFGMRRTFVTAQDMAPEWHLKMQAAFQKYTDNAVSKTVNLPNTATREDIASIYRTAYELGCKGVTVYRDGCKANQVLQTGKAQPAPDESTKESDSCPVQERPDIIKGFTQKVKTGMGELYLTVNEIDGKPFEVFATIGKSGRSVTAKAEAIGRLVSLALRSGISAQAIVNQMKGIGGENPIFREHGMLLSIPDAIARVLEKHYLKENPNVDHTACMGTPKCPDCGDALLYEEGCAHCRSCGYSKCS